MPVKVPKSDLWRAIRAKCYDCLACHKYDCESTTCALYFVLRQAKLPAEEWWRSPSSEWRAELDAIEHRKAVAAAKYNRAHGITTDVVPKRRKIKIVDRPPRRRRKVVIK